MSAFAPADAFRAQGHVVTPFSSARGVESSAKTSLRRCARSLGAACADVSRAPRPSR